MTNTQVAVDCAVMRGGTSKGLFFLASDLPADRAARDTFLLAAMGSPDVREIDGMLGFFMGDNTPSRRDYIMENLR